MVLVKVTGISLLLAVSFAAFFYGPLMSKERVPPIAKEMETLLVAMHQFRTTYGAYPRGSNAGIIRQLVGENSKRIVYLEPSESLISASGELTYPWGTPLRIQSSGSQIEIRSAGPDKIFGDTDDKVIERAE